MLHRGQNSPKAHRLRPLSTPSTPPEGKGPKYPPSPTAFKAAAFDPLNLIFLVQKGLVQKGNSVSSLRTVPRQGPRWPGKGKQEQPFRPHPSTVTHDSHYHL